MKKIISIIIICIVVISINLSIYALPLDFFETSDGVFVSNDDETAGIYIMISNEALKDFANNIKNNKSDKWISDNIIWETKFNLNEILEPYFEELVYYSEKGIGVYIVVNTDGKTSLFPMF